MNQTNILAVQADQLTASVLPMHGGHAHAVAHLKRLAGRGVMFLNACSNNLVRAPSRAAVDPNITTATAQPRLPFVNNVPAYHPRDPAADLGLAPKPR